MIPRMVCVLLIGLAQWLPSASSAADWSSCADDLDRLRRASSDAADIANDVESKADEFQNCKSFPEIYDLLKDGCSYKAHSYRSAKSSLDLELDTVNRRARSVSSSCSVAISAIDIPATSLEPSKDYLWCDIYRPYKGKLPTEKLIKLCTEYKSEPDCRKCLAK